MLMFSKCVWLRHFYALALRPNYFIRNQKKYQHEKDYISFRNDFVKRFAECTKRKHKQF